MKKTLQRIGIYFMAAFYVSVLSCSGDPKDGDDAFYTNPIISGTQSTAFHFYDSVYYYLRNVNGHILISSMKDPADFNEKNEKSACDMKGKYGLGHLWHPQMIRLDGKWYIYVTADDGDTDNHKMYVLENPEEDPLKGEFVMKSRLQTDKDDNWAMHGNVFRHKERLYMIWSGWESRRVYVEKQCLYIAEMDTPWSFCSDRVMISEPEYEWELQWIQRDGSSSTRYPVYVNENPFFFCNGQTDRIHLFYSASANWTAYHCVGELTADKNADLLDPASWKKNPEPVFRENREDKIFGPDMPVIIPSRDGTCFYMVYSAMKNDSGGYFTDIHCQPIAIRNGRPDLGVPASRETRLRKISTLQHHLPSKNGDTSKE